MNKNRARARVEGSTIEPLRGFLFLFPGGVKALRIVRGMGKAPSRHLEHRCVLILSYGGLAFGRKMADSLLWISNLALLYEGRCLGIPGCTGIEGACNAHEMEAVRGGGVVQGPNVARSATQGALVESLVSRRQSLVAHQLNR